MADRIDSIAGAVQLVKNAQTTIEPPTNMGKLTKKERTLFDGYIASKAHHDWFEHELVDLVHLARNEVTYEMERKKLKREGYVIHNPVTGVPMKNPRQQVVKDLMTQKLALARSLSMSSALINRGTKNAKAAKKQNDIADMTEKQGLLALRH